jgi:cysteate synthase
VSTKLVTIDDGDYPDAMELAAVISEMPYFHAEGGVKNVARRDGLGTVLLAAFEAMRCLPTYYFQAVGSGTGAIAVLETARRLARSAGEGAVLPRLMMCQNLPFIPIYEAWRDRKNHLVSESTERFRVAVRDVYADELTNWRPPYAVEGGVYDSLTASQGDVLVADNASARIAVEMFAELEGVDIEPAAGVALACLHDAIVHGRIDPESVVLLNVTGGGRLRLSKDLPLVKAEPQLRLARSSLAGDTVKNRIAGLFGI